MNRILTCGLATMFITVVTPTVFAEKDDHGRGGDGRGSGGAPHVSAPARVSAPHVSTAPRMSTAPRVANSNVMRAPSAPRVATQTQSQFRQAPIMRSDSTRSFAPSVARTQRNSPGVAFGGHVIDNNNTGAIDTRTRSSFDTTTPSTTQQFTTRRGESRDFRVPSETARQWDHNRVHEWNHHRYRYSGGSWIIIDPGVYDYGYPYDNGYGYGEVTYSSPSYGYSESLVMGAQDRLNRLGYRAGPADGVIGPQTRDAIVDFQEDNRLPVTGALDTTTVRALGL